MIEGDNVSHRWGGDADLDFSCGIKLESAGEIASSQKYACIFPAAFLRTDPASLPCRSCPNSILIHGAKDDQVKYHKWTKPAALSISPPFNHVPQRSSYHMGRRRCFPGLPMSSITTAPLRDSSSREPQDKNYSSPWCANFLPDQNLLAFVISSRGLPPTGDSL
jgi:hypothetical protein